MPTRSIALAAVLAVFLAAPAEPAAAPTAPAAQPLSPDTLVLVDDLGRRLRVEAPVRRIVSLLPAATEILFALGAGDRLVGRTRFDDVPPEAREVPSVGDGMRPSVELVVARRPELVILYAGADNAASLRQLERAGLSVLAVRHDRLEDLGRNIRRLGRLTGCERAAEALRRSIDEGLRRVERATAPLPVRRVYYEVWPDPPITVGRGSFLDTLVRIAGGRNVFGDLSAPSPQVSLEAIALRRPEVVLWAVPAGEAPSVPPPAERPGWRTVPAVRDAAVRRVDADLVHRLGPRLPDAAAALARAIHPEATIPAPSTSAGGAAPAGGGRAEAVAEAGMARDRREGVACAGG